MCSMKKDTVIGIIGKDCSKGCGRTRRKGGRYCAKCHRKNENLRRKLRRYALRTEIERLEAGIRILDRMWKRFKRR